jgi:intraflagellar transport protein 172
LAQPCDVDAVAEFRRDTALLQQKVIIDCVLQDNGQFQAAEVAFLQASKPREAIEMYCHQQMWDAALRVAESHDAASSTSILRQQADALVAEGRLADAEVIYVQVPPGHPLAVYYTAHM